MRHFFSLVGALALGAGAMYYLDPEQGRRRRALVGDKVDSLAHDARGYLDGRRKRATDRVRGLFYRVRGRLSSGTPDDQQLHGHVRARLGRAVSYPHAVETRVEQGRVVLKGDILERELDSLLTEIHAIRGVKAVDSQLSLHAEPGSVPRFQGRPHHVETAEAAHLVRDRLAVLAIAGGLGAALKALRTHGPAASMLLVTSAFLAYAMGGGARRRNRVQFQAHHPGRGGTAVQHHMPERASEGTPALLKPAIH